VHLLCIYSSAYGAGFISWSLDYETKIFTAIVRTKSVMKHTLQAGPNHFNGRLSRRHKS